MIVLLIVGIACVWCGIACGHRDIPVPFGFLSAIVAGFAGSVLGGIIGCFVLTALVVVAFALIPIPRDQNDDRPDENSASAKRSLTSKEATRINSGNPYEPPESSSNPKY